LRADLSGHGWWRWPIFGEDLIASSRRRLPELRSAGYRSAAVSISFAVRLVVLAASVIPYQAVLLYYYYFPYFFF
jgi:hypothetical protein